MTRILTARTMRDDVRALLPTGDTFAIGLSAISQGMSADALLDSLLPPVGSVDLAAGRIDAKAASHLPFAGTIAFLPQFGAVEFDGAQQINLIQWSTHSTVVVPDGEKVTLEWKIEDSSLPTVSGAVVVVGGEAGFSGEEPPTPENLGMHTETFESPTEGRRILRQASARGHRETFEMTSSLAAFVRQAVIAASRRVYRELNDLSESDRSQHVIDEYERETVIDQILYGSTGSGSRESGESSVTLRLIRRVAATDMALRKSVVGLVATNLWSSAAETHVRRYIGDPHLGRVIRRLARTIGSTDPEAVLAVYREQYPAKNIGLERIRSALSASATVHTDAVGLRDSDKRS